MAVAAVPAVAGAVSTLAGVEGAKALGGLKSLSNLAPLAAAELLKGVSPFVRRKRQLDKAAMASLDRDRYARDAVRRARQTMAPAYELAGLESRLRSIPQSAFVKATAGRRSPEQDDQIQRLFSGALRESFEQSGRERQEDLDRVEARAAQDAERIAQLGGLSVKQFIEGYREKGKELTGEGEEDVARLAELVEKLEKATASVSDTTTTA